MNQSKASQDELNVSQILLDLRKQLPLPEYLSDFKWGRARKRSRPDGDPPSPRESEKNSTAEKSSAASPTSPLSFSPSDSNNRKPREMEALIQNVDVPRGVMNVFPRTEVERNGMMDYRVSEYPIFSSGDDGVGPRGINLNVPPVDDSRVTLGDKRAKSADARKKRRVLMIAKKYPTQTCICSGAGPLGGEPLDDDRRAMYAETRRKRRELIRAKRVSETIRKRREQEYNLYVSSSVKSAEARRKRRELMRAKRESKLDETTRKMIELMRGKQESIQYVSSSAMSAEARRKRRELMRAKRV